MGDTEFVRFTLLTERIYKNRSGEVVIESTWHNVTALKDGKHISLDGIDRGSKVEVEGFIRSHGYAGSDGEYRYSTEIVAKKASFVTEG